MLSACFIGTCPRVAVYRGYCEVHKQKAEGGRPNAGQRWYNSRWRRVRAAFIAKHPTCEWCDKPTTDVDHRVSVKQALQEGWSHGQIDADDNLRAACHSCHSRRTAVDQVNVGS